MKEPLSKQISSCCCFCCGKRRPQQEPPPKDEEEEYAFQEFEHQPSSSIAQIAINTALRYPSSNRDSREEEPPAQSQYARREGDEIRRSLQPPPPDYDTAMKAAGHRDLASIATIAPQPTERPRPRPRPGTAELESRVQSHVGDAKRGVSRQEEGGEGEEEELSEPEDIDRHSVRSLDSDTTDLGPGILTPPSEDERHASMVSE
ncbi:Hypothetical predicted protein [Lecanosticta acicola]|uniref:Uncharacterized protein n=1 Tax=Lecanosticta acicola TaxID=111012 RepID=A0AAI9EAY4_9PEZI|nr:Hypothetical predicted protein [Lecanosticta acicola]